MSDVEAIRLLTEYARDVARDDPEPWFVSVDRAQAVLAALRAQWEEELKTYREALAEIRDMDVVASADQSPKYMQAVRYHQMRDIARAALNLES